MYEIIKIRAGLIYENYMLYISILHIYIYIVVQEKVQSFRAERINYRSYGSVDRFAR